MRSHHDEARGKTILERLGCTKLFTALFFNIVFLEDYFEEFVIDDSDSILF